jgi:hAT family C-terminal dimerisation region
MDGVEEPHEIDVYLTSAVEKVKDPLMWWWDHRKVYPNLSIMALDYLSAPGEQRHTR